MHFLRFMAIIATAVSILIPTAGAMAADDQRFPDIVGVKVRAKGPGLYDFDVTVSSPYDTPRRYADAFRVLGKDGKVYGERILLHDHAGEQPFTRDLYGVKIPEGVRSVVIQGRDREHGYGGKTMEVALPGR
jgi:hypothetical protein